MEQLPYIDEHSIQIDATREQVWSALAPVLRGDFAGAMQGSGARLLGTSGVTGHVYRALVIGTRGHRLVVRRLLRNIARRASWS